MSQDPLVQIDGAKVLGLNDMIGWHVSAELAPAQIEYEIGGAERRVGLRHGRSRIRWQWRVLAVEVLWYGLDVRPLRLNAFANIIQSLDIL